MLSSARFPLPAVLASCALAAACGAGSTDSPEVARAGADAGGDPGVAAHATSGAPTVSGVVLDTMDASAIGRGGAPAGPVEIPPGHPELGSREAAVRAGAVEPAAGGLTVAQVWQRREALAGHPVTVRGEVVKFNGGIMGTNWLHLQDGTGSAEEGTHDLTVTTDDRMRVGDVVTATGTVAVDRDFGAGYRYDVIVEKAEVEPG